MFSHANAHAHAHLIDLFSHCLPFGRREKEKEKLEALEPLNYAKKEEKEINLFFFLRSGLSLSLSNARLPIVLNQTLRPPQRARRQAAPPTLDDNFPSLLCNFEREKTSRTGTNRRKEEKIENRNFFLSQTPSSTRASAASTFEPPPSRLLSKSTPRLSACSFSRASVPSTFLSLSLSLDLFFSRSRGFEITGNAFLAN